MNAPILTVRAIKNILLSEWNIKYTESCQVLVSYIQDYLTDSWFDMKRDIESIETYEDCNNFISSHYRMGLNEWADSL